MTEQVRNWWWLSDNGKLCITVRYGAHTLEVLRSAVDVGELDGRIEVISGLVKSGYDKEAQTSKRPALKLPSNHSKFQVVDFLEHPIISKVLV